MVTLGVIFAAILCGLGLFGLLFVLTATFDRTGLWRNQTGGTHYTSNDAGAMMTGAAVGTTVASGTRDRDNSDPSSTDTSDGWGAGGGGGTDWGGDSGGSSGGDSGGDSGGSSSSD
jgi:hypothetical protein